MTKLNGIEVWVVGVIVYDEDGQDNDAWEIVGIFVTEKEAITHCTTEDCFVGPMVIGEVTPPEESIEWEGCYYPLEK